MIFMTEDRDGGNYCDILIINRWLREEKDKEEECLY